MKLWAIFMDAVAGMWKKGVSATVSVPLPTFSTNKGEGVLVMSPSDTFRVDRAEKFTENSTISPVYLEDKQICFVLEPSCRKENPRGIMAIPAGKYRIRINDVITTPKEHKFEMTLIQILNVPGRTNIECHPGDYATDTLGCLLPGTRWDPDVVWNSHVAFKIIKDEALKRLALGPVYFEITGGVL